MNITAINSTQQNQLKKQNFKGKFIYDELNFLPKQLKEIQTMTKNFDISKKPYDIKIYNDPRDSFLLMVAENEAKHNTCSVSIRPSRQRPKELDEKMASLISMYDEKFIKPNTVLGKIKGVLNLINPFRN